MIATYIGAIYGYLCRFFCYFFIVLITCFDIRSSIMQILTYIKL